MSIDQPLHPDPEASHYDPAPADEDGTRYGEAPTPTGQPGSWPRKDDRNP
jgi:hypothetical protein